MFWISTVPTSSFSTLTNGIISAGVIFSMTPVRNYLKKWNKISVKLKFRRIFRVVHHLPLRESLFLLVNPKFASDIGISLIETVFVKFTYSIDKTKTNWRKNRFIWIFIQRVKSINGKQCAFIPTQQYQCYWSTINFIEYEYEYEYNSKLSIHSKHSDTLTHSVSWHNFLLDTDQKHTAHTHQRESEKMIFHFANHRLLIPLTASRHPETERRDRASEKANKSSIWIFWLALIIGMASPKKDEKKFASVVNFQSITNEQ